MKKIRIYSDFNGVYNVLANEETQSVEVCLKSTYLKKSRRLINYRPDVVSGMVELLSTGLFDFVWHSTMNEQNDIAIVAEAIGMGAFKTASPAKLNSRASTRREWTRWKADFIIQDQMNDPCPFIWIDDTAHSYWGDLVDGSTRSVSLNVSTDSNEGLTQQNLVEIIQWVQALKPEALV